MEIVDLVSLTWRDRGPSYSNIEIFNINVSYKIEIVDLVSLR